MLGSAQDTTIASMQSAVKEPGKQGVQQESLQGGRWEVGAVAVMSKVWGEEMGVWEALWSLRFLEMEAFC